MKKVNLNFKQIEKDFFLHDDENKRIFFKLHFSSPESIIDTNAITEIPMLSDDFIGWVKESLEYTPKKYKIDLTIEFDDMGKYTEEELKNIFFKNIVLEAKKKLRSISVKNKIALGLIIFGIISLIAMIIMNYFWHTEDIGKQIVSYVFDILTTVSIWEAITIFIVENKEGIDTYKHLAKKFDSISFKTL